MEFERCLAWANLHGLIVSNNGQDRSIIHAPISLLPYQFPKQAFDQAKSLADIFNLLVHRVAGNSEWLLQTLENVLYLFFLSYFSIRRRLMTHLLED